jgi:hypothetical protein
MNGAVVTSRTEADPIVGMLRRHGLRAASGSSPGPARRFASTPLAPSGIGRRAAAHPVGRVRPWRAAGHSEKADTKAARRTRP